MSDASKTPPTADHVPDIFERRHARWEERRKAIVAAKAAAQIAEAEARPAKKRTKKPGRR